MKTSRLVVVSNRLPVIIKEDDTGNWQVKPGEGGLVTALAPVLRGRGGIWIGWPGGTGLDPARVEKVLAAEAPRIGYSLSPVALTADEVEKFYYGFSNEILWPLFHDQPSLCKFDPSTWPVYQSVNRKYAQAIADVTLEDDYVWVQDYHLLLVAWELMKLGAKRRMGFFLHIPFPAVDLFLKLPWRYTVLEAMLRYDMIGFQTTRDRRNFLDCVRTLMLGVKVQGGRQVCIVRTPEREIRVGAFPISIDYRGFSRYAATPEVAEEVRRIKEVHQDHQLMLGIDRLDYSKGIPERIRAFGHALDLYPDLRGKINLIQVVIPSRKDVPEYRWLKRDIERLVGKINGRFTQTGWVPIHYIYRSLTKTELVAYYRACEIALITPLKDGMNLVAKEFCACSLEEDCSLILSESAGAATQLHPGAILVNPHDIEGVAQAINTASRMSLEEKITRMKELRRQIKTHDVFHWVDSFLEAAFARNLGEFQVIPEYPQVPRLPLQNTGETVQP